MRKLLIQKFADRIPVEVDDAEVSRLISAHGAENVIDPETNEPVKLEAAAQTQQAAPRKSLSGKGKKSAGKKSAGKKRRR